jgi:uncharacterized tellurite resistance protein B-like protein
MNLTSLDRMILSQYSSLEKESIYQIVCAAMSIDGERDPREIRVVNEIVDVIGLTESEREASRRLDEPTMSQAIRSMNEIKRAYVGKFIAQVILADGKVTQREQFFFDYLFQHLNLPEMD